jgi:hypothetical protein
MRKTKFGPYQKVRKIGVNKHKLELFSEVWHLVLEHFLSQVGTMA